MAHRFRFGGVTFRFRADYNPVVGSVSTSRRWGYRAGAVVRVLSRQAKRAGRTWLDNSSAPAAASAVRSGKLGRALWAGTRATFASVRHTIAALWLQVTGTFFLLFALSGVAAAVHERKLWLAGHAPAYRFVIAALFSAMFAWFGVSSFWRAAKRGSKG
jgi:hypothetical protein